MSSSDLPNLMERDQIVKFQTLDRFTETFGTEPARPAGTGFIYVLICIKQGKGHCFVDNEYIPLQPGSLILVNPFAFLHLDDTAYVQGFAILFTEEFLCRNALHEQLLYKTVYLPGRKVAFQLEGQEVGNNYIQSQITMFGWEYRLGQDPLLKSDFLHNILLGIVIYFHKLQLEAEQGQLDITEPLVKNQLVQFIQLLNTYFKEESSLQFYADKMNVTQYQLAQICKKAINWSPKAIMQEKLLREAKRLLLFDTMSVKEISYDLGFTEPTNFVKFFQQHTGVSPKSFRSEHAIRIPDEQDDAA